MEMSTSAFQIEIDETGIPNKDNVRLTVRGVASIQLSPAPEDLNLRKIFLILRTRTGTDFTLYRMNTIRRRLSRRLGLHKLKDLEAYARFLREHPAEIEARFDLDYHFKHVDTIFDRVFA